LSFQEPHRLGESSTPGVTVMSGVLVRGKRRRT
jgi:hypothetical protein